MKADPPYTTGGNTTPEGGIPYQLVPSGKIVFDMTISSENGMEMRALKPLDVSIYDLSGVCVYSVTDAANIHIDGSKLPLANGLYMVRLTNKDGEKQVISLMFNEDTIMVNSKKN